MRTKITINKEERKATIIGLACDDLTSNLQPQGCSEKFVLKLNLYLNIK